MDRKSWLGVGALLLLTMLVFASRLLGHQVSWQDLILTRSFAFDFAGMNVKVSRGLEKIIQADLNGQSGTYAVYIENLASGEKYYFNEAMVFPSASLYKLVVMAAAMKEIEAGRLSLGQTLTGNTSHLQDVLGEEDFGYEDTPPQISMTVGEAMQRIGAVSDNYAAIMLTEYLRAHVQATPSAGDPLTAMASELQMRSTVFAADGVTTTASDIAIFFEDLYAGEVVSPSASQMIRDNLAGAQINDRTPALLPSDVKLIHKTGELAHLRHDAGIVYLDKNPYVIVLLGNNLPYEDDGVALEAKISKDVYDYFAEQPTRVEK